MRQMTRSIHRLLILLIIYAVFNLLVFIIPFQRDGAFWVAYGFASFTILAQALVDWVAFRNADTLKRVFMGIPIIKISFRCMVAQLGLCGLFMLLSVWLNIPSWIPVIPCLIILAFATVAVIKADWAREIIEKIDVKSAAESRFMHQLRADLDSLVPHVTDNVLRTKLDKLAEDVRYSDPVSSAGLEGLEANIKDKISLLKQAVSSADEESSNLTDELHHLVNERNNQCRALRRQQ
jgi:hypothetical protein